MCISTSKSFCSALRSHEPAASQVASEISTGAADINFLHADFTNAYSNLSNIVLKIVPMDAAAEKAVLVNAHFDSTLGSPGN
jgi:hypothetical protein